MSDHQVEMPDGRLRPYSAKTTADLKKRVAAAFGIEPDGIALLDSGGRPIPDNQPPPPNVQAVPKPEWGSDEHSSEYAFLQDVLMAQDAVGYQSQFYIRLIARDVCNPFRVYFYANDFWWPSLIRFDTYPITTLPRVRFDRLVPPCPIHAQSWHPNIYDTGDVCWGDVCLLPGTGIIGILNMVSYLLHSPNHQSVVHGRCN
jgi:hypothetical protein